MGNQLDISNVIEISVSQAQTGIGAYNVNNIGLFTTEQPGMSFSGPFQIYLDPTQVANDFGSSSQTFAMANAVFSQQPNILAGGGYLAIIPFIVSQQTIAFGSVAASGSVIFEYGGNPSAAVFWNDSVSVIQTKLRAIPGLADVTVSGSIASQSLVVSMYGIYDPTALGFEDNGLEDSGSVTVPIVITTTRAYETLSAAIVRTEGLVQYFGIMAESILPSADMLAAAAVVQPLNKIEFFVSRTEADIEPGGSSI